MQFKNFSEIWHGGFSALLEALKAEGFNPEANNSAAEGAKKNWAQLNRARSSTLENPENSFFTYLSRDSSLKISSGWGLIFADKKIAAQLPKELPVVAIERPDAAVDFILTKGTQPEWAGKSDSVPSNVTAESGVVIGPGSQIGDGTILEAGVRIGAHVKIGMNCRIGANTRISDYCEIGNNCVFTGCVSLGGPGFGFVHYPQAAARQQRMHVGRVILGDRVRLGAFVSIDRGVFEDTRLETDVAIDNIVQVSHNCVVGQATTLCGFNSLTGSTIIGKNTTFAGLVFTKGHLTVGDNVTVAGWSGITADVKSNQVLKGYPVKPLSVALKTQVLVDKLPELYERIKKLEKANK